MIAEFSVYLPGSVHMSHYLADVLFLLEERGIEHSLGATSTSLRGDPTEFFAVLEDSFELLRQEADEFVMNISLVARAEKHNSLNENVRSVQRLRKAR